MCGVVFPAISKHLKAFLYGWLPLSDAFGIFSLLRGMTKTKGNDRISVTPLGFFPLSPDLQGFSFAPPPACNLTPLRGLRSTECIMLQGFRFASPPACDLTPLRGLCGSECIMLQGLRFTSPLPVILLLLGDCAVVNAECYKATAIS